MRKTPLYEVHCQSGGKIIDFGGWALPVQYTDILEEHRSVRDAAGLFDVSHMGEITVKGPDAEQYLNRLVTNDISVMADGQIMYSPMCYADGGIVDDLLVYRLGKENYLVVVNAANTDKDYQWMLDNLEGNVMIANVSDSYAQLAIQGPQAEAVLQKLAGIDLGEIRFYRFAEQVDLGGIKALVSRSGYTGEDGFEVYLKPEEAPALWQKLLEAGKDCGLVPAGLGARDTLRFEAALPLYGQEISADISPLEAGLDRFVKLDKADFIGKAALVEQKQKGIQRKLVGFEMIDRGVARSHYEVHSDAGSIGFVTTGSFSPSLRKNLGLALVSSEYAAEGTEFYVVIRGKALKAKVVKKPFYSKKYKK